MEKHNMTNGLYILIIKTNEEADKGFHNWYLIPVAMNCIRVFKNRG